jgi:hypothetical protein
MSVARRCGIPLTSLDNSRLLSEFTIQYPPFQERVLQIINDIRREVRLPLVG